MNSQKIYIIIIQKIAKMNVKKIVFFTFAFFSPVAVFGGGDLVRGYFTIISAFHFRPSPIRVPHTAYTQKSHPLPSPLLISPLIYPNTTPLFHHNPISPSHKKTTQFRHKSQHQYIKPKQIQAPTQQKALSNWPKPFYWLIQNNSKLVQSILPKILIILAARPLLCYHAAFRCYHAAFKSHQNITLLHPNSNSIFHIQYFHQSDSIKNTILKTQTIIL